MAFPTNSARQPLWNPLLCPLPLTLSLEDHLLVVTVEFGTPPNARGHNQAGRNPSDPVRLPRPSPRIPRDTGFSVEKNLASGTWYFCCKMLWSAGFPPTRPFQFSLGHDSLFMLLIMVSEALRVSRFAMRALHQKKIIFRHLDCRPRQYYFVCARQK